MAESLNCPIMSNFGESHEILADLRVQATLNYLDVQKTGRVCRPGSQLFSHLLRGPNMNPAESHCCFKAADSCSWLTSCSLSIHVFQAGLTNPLPLHHQDLLMAQNTHNNNYFGSTPFFFFTHAQFTTKSKSQIAQLSEERCVRIIQT